MHRRVLGELAQVSDVDPLGPPRRSESSVRPTVCGAGVKAELTKTQAKRIAWSISRRLLGASGSEFVTIERTPRIKTGPNP
jgi:hypothetical protein